MQFPVPVGPELEKNINSMQRGSEAFKSGRAGKERNMNNEKAGHVLFILNKVNVITVGITHT